MMELNSTPLAVAFGYGQDNNTLSFITREGVCTIQGKTAVIESILKCCNGINTVADIIQDVLLTRREVCSTLNVLENRLIVVDSKKLYTLFHRDVSNLSPYKSLISPVELDEVTEREYSKTPRAVTRSQPSALDDLLVGRDTTRNFDGTPLSEEQLFAVLEHAYKTRMNMAVPSAGSIYPLAFYVVILKSMVKFPEGLYRYIYEEGELEYTKPVNKDFLRFGLGDDRYVDTAAAVIFLAANLPKITKKYANRGYYFALIEVGHVAQNMQLLCSEKKIGILEYGALVNEAIDRFIVQPDAEVQPTTLLAILLGNKALDEPKRPSHYKALWSLISNYVGEHDFIKDIDSEVLTNVDYLMPRNAAFCSYESLPGDKNSRKGFAFGTDYSRRMALIKAIAEAVERYFAGAIAIDIKARYEMLIKKRQEMVDPKTISYINENYYLTEQGRKLSPFNPRETSGWVRGTRLKTGIETLVLADQTYYPIDATLLPGGRRAYRANSTGVAASFSQDDARERALLELIERDAFSLFWYGTKIGKRLKIDTLPQDIQERINMWLSKGDIVDVVDITYDSVPVMLLTVRRKSFPYLATGCAARFTIEDALLKALDEMEATAMSWMDAHYQIDRSLRRDSIQSPRDHGLFYALKANRQKAYAEIVLQLPEIAYAKRTKPYTNAKLIQRFNPVEVILHKPSFDGDLWVVRELSEKLILLNFGVGNEPLAHPRLLAQGATRWTVGHCPPHFFP